MAKEVLRVENLVKYFPDDCTVAALDHVSLTLHEKEILGIVGESGSGKSTLAKAITRLLDVEEGQIYLCQNEISQLKGAKLRNCYKQMQMIFQDATNSFDARIPIGKSIGEVLKNFTSLERNKRRQEAENLLSVVGLKKDYYDQLPGQLSGGECQRAAIARAIAADPRLLICDEATSALDVSMQAQIVELLKNLSQKRNMAILFICHDLALVNGLCDRIAVMYQGKIVEQGQTDQVIRHPTNPYTRQLLQSVLPVYERL